MHISFAASLTLIAGCSGKRIAVESGSIDAFQANDGAVASTGTLPYETRFGSEFSLADAAADLRRQMCEVYLSDVSVSMLAWHTTPCQDWVAEKVTIEDGPLITINAGDPSDPLVIFIHGWPDTAATWVNQFMFLSENYRCVAVQLPDYLDALPTEGLYLDQVVDRVGEVLNGRQAFLVGHDFGANFGYMVAYKFPELILKYAAIDIGNDQQMMLGALNPTTIHGFGLQAYQTTVARIYREPGLLDDAILGAFELGSFSGHATARMGVYYERLWNEDTMEFHRRLAPDVPEDEWESIWTPLGGTGIPQDGMLYIWGSGLATTPEWVNTVRASGGRAVDMTELPGANHWPHVTVAASVTAELMAWLSRGVGDEVASEEYPLVFSIHAAEQEIKEAMCETYWVQDAHPLLTDCRSEVHQKITIEDGPLVTARAGDPANQMIVFIHGWPDSAAIWVNQLLRFSQSYYCVAVQLPNYLDALPTEELYVDQYVARIGEVIGDRETIVVGHDFGAILGYMVAYMFPDVVLRYASLDIGNDLQMWIDVDPETRELTRSGPRQSWNAMIVFYQEANIRAYRNCAVNLPYIESVSRVTPGGHATCRMGELYARMWNRTEFQQRLVPDVAPEDWQSFFTPLGGTGIPQSGMLYIQGGQVATTDAWLDAVRADSGTVVQLIDGQAGHWLPVQGTTYVNNALDQWFAGTGADLLDSIPYDLPAYTGCSPLIVQDVYAHGFRFSETRLSAGKMSFYARCAGDVSTEPNINKISCQQRHCGGHAWCFVANRCWSRGFYNACSALSNQNPLNCAQ